MLHKKGVLKLNIAGEIYSFECEAPNTELVAIAMGQELNLHLGNKLMPDEIQGIYPYLDKAKRGSGTRHAQVGYRVIVTIVLSDVKA